MANPRAVRHAVRQYAVIDVAAETQEVVEAQGAGKAIVVLGFSGTGAVASTTLTWKSAATAISGPIYIQKSTSLAGPYSESGVFKTAANEALNLTSTQDGYAGVCTYVVVDV